MALDSPMATTGMGRSILGQDVMREPAGLFKERRKEARLAERERKKKEEAEKKRKDEEEKRKRSFSLLTGYTPPEVSKKTLLPGDVPFPLA